jgi:hypothetical protein
LEAHADCEGGLVITLVMWSWRGDIPGKSSFQARSTSGLKNSDVL